MEEKYIMMDVLNTEKNLTSNTVTALNEASCDPVYKVYYDIFKKVSKEAKDIFTFCFNQGWYPLEESPTTKITKEYDKLTQELAEDSE